MQIEPTKTKMLIKSYEKTMHGYYRDFKKNVMRRLRSAVSTNKQVFDDLHTYSDRKKIHNSAISDINMIIDEYDYEHIAKHLRPTIRRYTNMTYEKGAMKGATEVNRIPTFDIHFGLTRTDFEAIEVMLDHDFMEIRSATNYMKKEMVRVISTGMLEGQSMGKMSRELVSRIDASRKRTDMIIRTEVIRNYNQAAVNKYKEAGIRRWRWITAFDERTCEICTGLDGRIFSVGDEQPPVHPNCHCAAVPFIDEKATPGRKF